MDLPEIFIFGSVVSSPIFGVVTLVLLHNVAGFSLKKQTISKTVLLLEDPIKISIFKLNFLFKAVLDLAFYLYLIEYFDLQLHSFITIALLFSAIFFGLLGYFTEGKYSFEHKILVYSSGLLLVFAQIGLANLIGNDAFLIFSLVFLLTPTILGLASLVLKKVNVLVQLACASLGYIWLIVLVFRFL